MHFIDKIFDKQDVGSVSFLDANETTRPRNKIINNLTDVAQKEMWLVLLGDTGS